MNIAARAIANDAAMDSFSSLDPKVIAILLDVDGTLIDIAPSPHEVDVPDELRISLERLSEQTGGALALVSGRPIGDLDLLFAPLRLPTIGGHGAEMRIGGTTINRSVKELPAALRERLKLASKLNSGIVVEDKGYSLALHYRKAPQYESMLLRHIADSCAAFAGEPTEVLPGKSIFEIKRPSVNKGDGVRELMQNPPFAGRMPVFIGDDITDESVFAVLTDLGGKGLKGMGFSVTRQFPGVTGIFESPAQVRQALQRLASARPARAP